MPSQTSAAAGNQLFQALLAAQKELRAVPPDARNEFHKYDYASAERIIQECRQALHRHGILVWRGQWQYLTQPIPMVQASVHVVLAETGEALTETFQFPVLPSGSQPLDKAVATALTSGLKYFLRDLLLVPRIALDEDMDTRDDRQGPAEPVPAVPAAPIVKSTATPPEPRLEQPPSTPPIKPIRMPTSLREAGEMVLQMANQDKARAADLWFEITGRYVEACRSGLTDSDRQKLFESVAWAYDDWIRNMPEPGELEENDDQ